MPAPTVRVPAGRYEIQQRTDRYGVPYYGINYIGILARTTWHGSNTRVETPCTHCTAFAQLYEHDIVWAIIDGRTLGAGKARVALAEGWEAHKVVCLDSLGVQIATARMARR